MSVQRKYNCKDVDMLVAAKTVSENLGQHLAELSLVRSNWSEDYTNALKAKIDDAIANQLGVDKKKDLRAATSNLKALQAPALRDLSFFKTQFEVDFTNDPRKEDLLKQFGFDKNLTKARRNNQEALIELLYAFKTNMTDVLKAEIVAKGTNPALIDGLIAYADQVKDANVSQEALKKSPQIMAESTVKLYNDIYDEVIGICKIAASYYQDDPLKKAQFSFNGILQGMGSGKSSAAPPETAGE